MRQLGNRALFWSIVLIVAVVLLNPWIFQSTYGTSPQSLSQVQSSIVGTSTSFLAVGDTQGYNQGGFYAAGRYWTWYSDGTDEVMVSSVDGVNWGNPVILKSPGTSGSAFSGVFDGTYFHYIATYNRYLGYRRGLPNSDGSITWSAPEQTAVACNEGVYGCDQQAIGVDSTGHVWVGYATPVSDVPCGLPTNPYLTLDANTNGTWQTMPGYPIQLSSDSSGPYCDWGVIIVPLSNGQVYVLYSHCNNPVYGRLWTGSGWDQQETVTTSIPFGNTRYVSAVGRGSTVYVVVDATGTDDFRFTERVDGQWTPEREVYCCTRANWPLYVPALSLTSSGGLVLFWTSNSDTTNTVNYELYSGTGWGNQVSWITEPFADSHGGADVRNIFVYPQDYGVNIGVTYESGLASPWNIDIAFLNTGSQATSTTSSTDSSTANSSQITVASTQSGPGYVVVDGTSITTPQTFSWTVGSTHTITANSPVSCGPDCEHVWSSWSDGGAQFHEIVVPSTNTAYTASFQQRYYSEVTMIVNFTIEGGGSPDGAPAFSYVEAGVPNSTILTTASTSIEVDSGSSWSVTPNPLACSGPSERWQSSQALTGSASATTIVFNFYHQYLQTLSYSVIGGGSPSAPSFTGTQFGTSASQVLTSSPTAYWYDAGSSWSVTNPLSGLTGSEQWVANQTTGTIQSSQALAIGYQHQYMLTMQVSPSGGGTAMPNTGWQNATAVLPISETPSSGFTFSSWRCSGAGCYSGAATNRSITMNNSMTENATFVGPAGGRVTMTISYQVVGSGTPTAPVFNYVLVGISKSLTITKTPMAVTADAGSPWSVTPNPLTGSGSSQRWFSTQTLSGTASATALVFTFQHQYYLTMKASGVGAVSPSSGWQNADAKVTITATPSAGHKFKSWAGSGTGSYTGTSANHTITMKAAITENATFT